MAMICIAMMLALVAGAFLPDQAGAAITTQSPWTNAYHSATIPGATAASFAVTGTPANNRMLVVGITAEGSTSGTYTYTSVQYGGQTLTLAGGDGGTSLSQHSLLFYLKDNTVMDGTAKTLAVNGAAFGGTSVMHNIWYAVYAGVDQADTPASPRIQQYNSAGTAVTSAAFAAALTVNANDQAVMVACAARAAAAVTWNAPTNWTKGNNQPTGTTGLGFVAYRTIPGTNTTDTASATGITSSRVSMTAMSMKEAPTDTTPPSVTINQEGGQADPAGSEPINFTVVFSESVSNFATGDVTISGTAGGTKTATVTGSGTTYNVAVTGMTTGGTVIANIAAGVATDAAGNGNTAATFTDNSVTWTSGTPQVPVGGWPVEALLVAGMVAYGARLHKRSR